MAGGQKGGWLADKGQGGGEGAAEASPHFPRDPSLSFQSFFSERCLDGEMLTLWLLLPMACGAPDLANQAEKIFLHLKLLSKHVGYPPHNS